MSEPVLRAFTRLRKLDSVLAGVAGALAFCGLALGSACSADYSEEPAPGPDGAADVPSAPSGDSAPPTASDAGEDADANVVEPTPDASAPDGDAAVPGFDPTFPPSFVPNDSCAGASRFCATFDGNTSVASLPPWIVTQSGGSLTLAVPSGGTNRAIRTESVSSAGAKNVSLVWDKWGTNGTEPLIVNDGQTVELSFSFRIERADSYAFVGGLTFDGTTYGLSVYPAACGAGVSCVQENRRTGETVDLVAASAFDPTKFHRARVRVKRGAPSWTGSIMVGDRTISMRPDAFPANATDTVPARLEFGILRTGNDAAKNIVWIDDARVTVTGP